MTAVQILASIGFADATELSQRHGETLVRVRTSNGWVYERFRAAELQADIEKWAAGRSPE